MSIVHDNFLHSVDQAIEKTSSYFFATQRPEGFWRDYTASSALATAMCTLTLYYADAAKYADFIARGCEWLRETQHPDGGWGDAIVDPSNLNATAFALPALKIIEPERSRQAIEQALGFIEARGGQEALRDPKRSSLFVCCLTFMALAGIEGYSWDSIPRLPVGLILVPQQMWQEVSFGMPAVFSLGFLHNRRMHVPRLLRPLIRFAEPRALAWLRKVQGSNGGFQESPLLAAVNYVGLHCAGMGQDIAERCLGFILTTRREDGSWTCQRYLDVSVTTYILEALETVGSLEDTRLKPTIDWLLAQQYTEPFFATHCAAGAWSWGRPSGWVDMDDTAGALSMLRRMGVPNSDPHIQLGYTCLRTMQNHDGSWGMFVRHTRFKLEAHGGGIDKPCPALTARIVIALYDQEHSSSPALEKALEYLRAVQKPDGAIQSLWFHDYVYGTSSVLDAFATIGRLSDPMAGRCLDWLLANQNDDGSWGGQRGIPGTVEETAWGLIGLLSTGVTAPEEAINRAAAWLIERQQAEGTWQPSVVGVYFPSLWYSDDHIANGFALRALGRYWRWKTGQPHQLQQSHHGTEATEEIV